MEAGIPVLKNCQTEKEIPVDSFPYVIGRCRTANFIIAHVNVSRNHCRLIRENFLWKVYDYSSSGTYVNDELVGRGQARILSPGDVIRFGPIESNLCWKFQLLNKFTSDCDTKDHTEYKPSNDKASSLKTNSDGDDSVKMCEELQEKELKMSAISDTFLNYLEQNKKNFEFKDMACEKIEDPLGECQDKIIECRLNERKCIVQKERFQNKNHELSNSDLAEKKIKLRVSICENQAIEILKKKSNLQNESLQSKEDERDESKDLSGKQNKVNKVPKTLSQKSHETYIIKELSCSEDLEKNEQKNIHNQNLCSSKKARIEIETNVAHGTEQTRTEKTEELMKELEQLKNVLNDLEHKNFALKGELAAASNSKNVASEIKSNILENFADLMEDEFQCTICSELFVQAVTLSCTHTFCKFCISQWRKKQKTCPICRKKITNETRSLVVDNYIDKMVGNLSLELKERREAIIVERNQSSQQKKVKTQKAKTSNFR